MNLALFAGIDGWGLGPDAIHVELDPTACATLAALGVPVVRADVATYPLAHFPDVEGIVASPPCQTFSSAGEKEGIRHLGAIVTHAHACADGWHPWAEGTDPRTALVLEPLRYALTLRPRWLACEQVRAVLPVWEAIAHVLRAHGYSVWTGLLEAADYGVPQTRTRAILMAHRDRAVTPPEPTHAKDPAPGLFGTLEQWVTMADALGWTGTVGFPRRDDRGGDGYRERDVRDVREPAFTLTEKARSWTLNTGRRWPKGGDRSGAQAVDRGAGPAPALTAISGGQWLLMENEPEDVTLGDRYTSHGTIRRGDQPAPTLTASLDNGNTRWEREPGLVGTHVEADVAEEKPWAYERPATTLATRPLVADPGTNANRFNGATKSRNDGIKITVEEALVLQSFPPDWPVQGTRTAKFRQVGNAIPIRLGRAILSELR